MSWETLKAAVTAVITSNGANEISGEVLRNLLNVNVIPQLGANLYKGVAVPATNPGSVEKENWYFATTDGIYTHFSGLVLDGEFAVLKYTGSAWVKDTVFLMSGIAASLDPVTVVVPFGPYSYDIPEGKLLDQIALISETDQNIVIEIEVDTADVYNGPLDSASDEALVLVINRMKKTGLMPIYFKDFTDPFTVKFYYR